MTKSRKLKPVGKEEAQTMKYEEPKMEVILFEAEDIITASEPDWGGDEA